jgi:hypothetical protein
VSDTIRRTVAAGPVGARAGADALPGAAPSRPFTPHDAGLVASRSLVGLLRLSSLSFKLEVGQPSASWLDRGAGALVGSALSQGASGLGVVAVGPLSLALAVRCARVGLRLVVLVPGGGARSTPGRTDRTADQGWLSVLGAQLLTVDASPDQLSEAAPPILADAGLRPVGPDDPLLEAGLATLVDELAQAGLGDDLLALPELTGSEPGWLEAAAARLPALRPLPIDGLGVEPTPRPFAVVGRPDAARAGRPDALVGPAVAAADEGLRTVLRAPVSPREADAARRLLAREEGLLASRRGVAGLAALIRLLREDRGRRPRERRLSGVTSAVVVLTGEPDGVGGAPPVAPDDVAAGPVSLEAVRADLGRLLVEPPGPVPG